MPKQILPCPKHKCLRDEDISPWCVQKLPSTTSDIFDHHPTLDTMTTSRRENKEGMEATKENKSTSKTCGNFSNKVLMCRYCKKGSKHSRWRPCDQNLFTFRHVKDTRTYIEGKLGYLETPYICSYKSWTAKRIVVSPSEFVTFW